MVRHLAVWFLRSGIDSFHVFQWSLLNLKVILIMILDEAISLLPETLKHVTLLALWEWSWFQDLRVVAPSSSCMPLASPKMGRWRPTPMKLNSSLTLSRRFRRYAPGSAEGWMVGIIRPPRPACFFFSFRTWAKRSIVTFRLNSGSVIGTSKSAR